MKKVLKQPQKEYENRYIYFVVDGQDCLQESNFLFSFIEVNARLNALVSDKVRSSKAAQRMDFYQQVDLAKPSAVLQQQMVLEILNNVNDRL